MLVYVGGLNNIGSATKMFTQNTRIEGLQKERDFRRELCSLLNSYNKEASSNTPDFILCEYLMSCLDAFNVSVNARNKHQEGK